MANFESPSISSGGISSEDKKKFDEKIDEYKKILQNTIEIIENEEKKSIN